MATIREFTREDWFGFADAQPFDDGAPLIVDDLAIEPWRIAGTVYEHVLVIVDEHGAEVFFCSDYHQEEAFAHAWRASFTAAEGRTFAAEIVASLEAGKLPPIFEIVPV